MKRVFLSGLFVLCVSTAAWAVPPIDLGTLTVSTASRMAQNDYKIPANVTVITKKQIEQSNAQTIPDLLKEALGVHVTDNSTNKTAVLDIRGFGDTASRNVLILVNDRKINTVDVSSPDLIQIPLEAVERVEIIRGAGSVLYGDNAVGGVVNIITKKGEGNLTGRLGTWYGSYDSQGTDVEVSGEKNNVSYFAYSKYFDQRGYRQNSDVLSKDFNTRFGYDFSDKIKADLNMGVHEDDYGLPGGLTDAQLRSLGRTGTNNPEDFASTDDRFVKLSLDVNPWPEDMDFGSLVFDFSYRNRDVYDAFFGFGEFSTKRNIDTTGVNGRYIFDKTLFDHEVNFVTGVDFYDTENDILGSGSNADDVTISKEEFGAYANAQLELVDDIFANGGVRYHQAEFAFSQRNGVAIDQKQRPDEWVYSGGFRYEYAPGSNAHLSAQRTFRFLASDEWYSTANFPGFGITPGLNLNLDQQTGMQYEAGIKHNFDDKISVNVTPYWIYLNNEIFFDPVTFGNSNYNKTKRFGVEVGQEMDILKWVDLSGLDQFKFFTNYDYQNARFLKGSNDNKFIPAVPQHQINAGVNVGFFDHFNASLIHRYIGSRFAINDVLNVTSPAKPYNVLDGKISYSQKNWEVYGEVNNILNEKYFTYVSKSTSSTTKNYFPAPERNFNIGMNIKF